MTKLKWKTDGNVEGKLSQTVKRLLAMFISM